MYVANKNQSRQGRLKITQDAVLGILILQSPAKPRTGVLAYFTVPSGLNLPLGRSLAGPYRTSPRALKPTFEPLRPRLKARTLHQLP